MLVIFLDLFPSTALPITPKPPRQLGLPQPPAAAQNACGASCFIAGTSKAWGCPVVAMPVTGFCYFLNWNVKVPRHCWAICLLIPVSTTAGLLLFALFIKVSHKIVFRGKNVYYLNNSNKSLLVCFLFVCFCFFDRELGELC